MSDFVLQNLPDGTQNPSWVAARRGMLGASQITNIRVGPRGGQKARNDLIQALVAERLVSLATNKVNPEWPDIKRGIETEPVALAIYGVKYKVWLEPPAWITHPTIEFSGATPDGRVEGEGLVQVKAPNIENYLAVHRTREIPKEYLDQMAWELAVCPWAKWNDYVPCNLQMPENKQLFRIRMNREDVTDRITELEGLAVEFLKEVDAMFTDIAEREFE